MKNILSILTGLLIAQLVSAQSLVPTAFASTARVSVKANASLSGATGQLTLRNTSAPAKTTIADESASMEVYPNPAVGSVSFNFQMAGQGKIAVSLTNSLGQKLSDVFAGNYDNGKMTESMDVSNYAPGMYFLSLQYTDASGKLHNISKKFQVI
jgi:hypothetical protein